MGSTVKIEEMTSHDLDEVLALWTTIEGVGLNESDTRERLAVFLIRNPHLSLVARCEARLVGALLCGHDGRRGYLHHLAVDEPYRNQGLGTSLVDRALSKLAAAGISRCNIFVYGANGGGAQFWRRRGWQHRDDLDVMQIVTPSKDAEQHPHEELSGPEAPRVGPAEHVILEADFANPLHCSGIVEVLNSYASDPVGGGVALTPGVQKQLVPALRDHPTRLVLLALHGSRAVGVAVCFFGFSTFQARPLLNVHDLAVIPAHRGKGIGRALLAAAESWAQSRGCCKLTLEVQDDNRRARGLYESFGFTDFDLGNSAVTRFLSKPLPTARPISLVKRK